MKVIILAAGQGTRLRPLTDNKPKCMVELLEKPLIQHQIETLRRNGIDDIHIATGYLQEKIDFDQEIFVTVANFNLNKKQLAVSKRANEVADKRFFVSKQRYLLGKTLITDLQIAQQEKDRSLINYINAYRSFWVSYYDVRKLTHYDFEQNNVIKN